jgi:hypothetical protein
LARFRRQRQLFLPPDSSAVSWELLRAPGEAADFGTVFDDFKDAIGALVSPGLKASGGPGDFDKINHFVRAQSKPDPRIVRGKIAGPAR